MSATKLRELAQDLRDRADTRERWALDEYERGNLFMATWHYGIAQGYRDDAAKLELRADR